MGLDDSVYCTLRDVVRDAQLAPETRDRLLAALSNYRALEVVADSAAIQLQGNADPVPGLMLCAALRKLGGA